MLSVFKGLLKTSTHFLKNKREIHIRYNNSVDI
jgi:hypothetical protein